VEFNLATGVPTNTFGSTGSFNGQLENRKDRVWPDGNLYVQMPETIGCVYLHQTELRFERFIYMEVLFSSPTQIRFKKWIDMGVGQRTAHMQVWISKVIY